ncbi:hypothetical protein PVW51_10110 [Sulfitobacter sp. PR48]|uniref:hypothetical protein n=1 Tax=Sulfitobacter sp. PR48 TaxID=3028383 RepID=UPI00237AF926|nr:hypothetical protein [Sulfitobacter sp. PR48]MDD9721050.1 hypothetical protein [Sulfitobacter sp. PR48]
MTELIARIAGPYLLLTGLGFAVSRNFYQRMVMGNAQADPILLNLSGAVHFIVGLIVLNNHFRWSGLAEIVVSIIGIAAAAKGAALIAVPEMTLQTPKTTGRVLTASTVGFILAGVYLCYVGYLPLLAR